MNPLLKNLQIQNLFAAAWTGATSEPENMKKIDGKPFYVITNADELAWFGEQVNGGRTNINAVLVNDIDVSGASYPTMNTFEGIIDGGGKKLICNGNGSFINTLTKSASLKNIIVDHPYRSSYFIENSYGEIINATFNGSLFIMYNYGNISYCTSLSEGALIADNLGNVEYCEAADRVVVNNMESGIVKYSHGSFEIVYQNDGKIIGCFSGTKLTTINNGYIKSSYVLKSSTYYLNNTEVSSTSTKMQTDQFAWILNTSNGTEENSGIWSRGTDGYPTWANENSLAIFKIAFNDDGIITNRYTNYKGLVTFPEDPEPAEGYIFTGWYNADGVKVKPTTVFTADQTVNAVYMDASDVYWTINFYNAAPADTLLEGKSYQHGSIVTYGGADPTLTATAKYTYTFKGWDVEPTNAVEDFNYHAIYDSTIRSYTITFNNSDGSKIENATFEYGKKPSCSKTPTRDATVEWKYTHKGWKPALDYVTEEATYTAIYDSVKVEYKVTFMNGTEIIDEQMVPYGGAAVAPTGVTREGYKFVGWNTSFAKVTTTLTVKALFEELIVRSVNVVNADGEKIDNQKIEDGETYTLPEAPKKEGYTFDAYYDGSKKLGVAGDEITITASITITAKYIKNPESSSSSKEIASSSSQNSVKSSSSTKVVSSSSSAKSSSSSKQPKSSSSGKKTEAIITNTVPQFSVHVEARNLQISGAKIGATYALFDMQGKVLLQGHTYATNFDLNIARPGNYLLKIGASTQKIRVK